MTAPTVPGVAHTLGAFRGCDAHERHHGIAYRAVMEWTGPASVAAVVDAGRRAGMLHEFDQDCPSRCGDHYAVLDLIEEAGDLVDDYCIPDRAAWEWWVKAIELRATSSDCPVDEPAAYRATYPGRPW